MNNQIINEYIKAVKDGNVDEVVRLTDRGRNKELLDAIPNDTEDRNTLPALFVAIQNDNTEMLEKLLMMGADTEIGEAAELYDPETRQLYEDITPIYYAIHKGSPEAVRMLIASGANLNHYTSNSGTDAPNWEHPLAYAVQMAGEEPETMLAIIDLILSSGENIDQLEVTADFPILNKSVDLHAFAITKLLIDKYQHADTDEIIYRDEYGVTDDVPNLLMRAIRETESPDEIVNFLLENGADPNNNIGYPYGYHQILDPEFARAIESTEYQVYFDFTKERLEEYLREVMVGRVAELDNRMQTALDFAMRNDASPEMINALRAHGGETTWDILRNRGIDFDSDYDPNNDSWASSEGEGYAEIDTENSEIRSKLLDIPVMTKEQYQQCRVAMNTQDNEPLHDFLTGEELYPEDVVILPTETSNVTCMDRDSFVDYMVHQSKNYDPLLHPYTREDMNNLPGFVFDEWWAENYPLGTTHYKEALKKVRLATNGGARRATNTKTQTKRKRLRTKRLGAKRRSKTRNMRNMRNMRKRRFGRTRKRPARSTKKQRGGDPDDSDDDSDIALGKAAEEFVKAAKAGDVGKVRELIAAGGAVNNTDDGYSPLYAASYEGHVEVVRELLKAGAAVDQTNEDVFRYTPLLIASEEGHVEVVRELLKAGARIDQRNSFVTRKTSLMHAADRDHMDVVRVLINAGALELRPSDTIGVVGNAVEENDKDIIKMVVRRLVETPGLLERVPHKIEIQDMLFSLAEKPGNEDLFDFLTRMGLKNKSMRKQSAVSMERNMVQEVGDHGKIPRKVQRTDISKFLGGRRKTKRNPKTMRTGAKTKRKTKRKR